jgi:hypothetical protein
MSLQPAAEASAVDKPAKTAKPAPRKRTAAARTTPPRTRKAPAPPIDLVESASAPPAVDPVKPRKHGRAIAGFGLVLAAAVAAVLLTVDRGSNASTADSDAAVAVSDAELASFARTHGAPVYWAGRLPSRTLELTRTAAGTFVRYLPDDVALGGSTRALTVATYPMRNAYATAASRGKGAGMISRTTGTGGLAVWSKAQPTSVYVAFRGVPSLVEIYAPVAAEARTIALSGRLRPVG